MPTVQEILKQTGLSDAEIAALDQRIVGGFSTVLTTAEQVEKSAREQREQAELAKRSQEAQYKEEIVPALNTWGSEKATIMAEREFYRTQAEQAKANGFLPKDAPGYVPQNQQPRNQNGEYVQNGNGVPGSPQFMKYEDGIKALSNVQYVSNEHIRLYGTPMPDRFENLVAEAAQQRMDFNDYVDRKYGFATKRQEIERKKAEDHDKEIADKAIKERDQYWAERTSGNPNTRIGADSEFATLRKGVDTKAVKDPLTFKTKEERHAYTRDLIQRDIAENAQAAS